MPFVTTSDKSTRVRANKEAERDQSRNELMRLGRWLLIAIAVAALSAGAAISQGEWAKPIGIVTLTGLVGFAAGALFGFLFGIPRTMTSASNSDPVTQSNGSTDRSDDAGQMRSNTNLEELSDWLTKIIVGVGLTQLYQLSSLLVALRNFLVPYFSPGSAAPLVALLALIFGVTAGFLWLYLETRTVLGEALNEYNKKLRKLSEALSTIASTIPTRGRDLAPNAEALKRAAEANPSDEVLNGVAIKALAASGRTDDAKSMVKNTDSILGQINRMLIALYKPGGYSEALAIGEKLVSESDARGNSDFWVYFACANGQMYHDLLQKGSDQETLQRAREAVLRAARQAVFLDPAERTRLYWFAHPENSSSSIDNDLVDFKDDPEFQAIVGDQSGR